MLCVPGMILSRACASVVVHGPNCTSICLVSMLNNLFMDIEHVVYDWWHDLLVYGTD